MKESSAAARHNIHTIWTPLTGQPVIKDTPTTILAKRLCSKVFAVPWADIGKKCQKAWKSIAYPIVCRERYLCKALRQAKVRTPTTNEESMSGGMDTPRGYYERQDRLEAQFKDTSDDTLADISRNASLLARILRAWIRALQALETEQERIADDATTEYLRRDRAKTYAPLRPKQ